MSDKRGSSPPSEPTARLDELKEQIERASALIGELRETNYSLATEIAELKNRLATGEGGGNAEAPVSPSKGDNGLTEELELLRSERETVRKKLRSLIARIDKLES